MKKTYEKPEIMFESFTASTNIAGNCEVKTDTPHTGVCAYTYKDEFLGDLAFFLEGITLCKEKPADGMFNGFCYDVPTEANNLFNS